MDPDATEDQQVSLTVDAQCSTCRAPVARTTTTAGGKLMLVDPHQHEDGTLRVEADLFGTLTSTVVAPGSEHVLFLPHWATCPDANHHRNPRRTRA